MRSLPSSDGEGTLSTFITFAKLHLCRFVRPLFFLIILTTVPVPAGSVEIGAPSEASLAEMERVRKGLGIDRSAVIDIAWLRTFYGRKAEEVEGWRKTGEDERWPVDQATYDIKSGLISKYVNFEHVSRRKGGESILPMSTVSTRADGYLALLYRGTKLSLEKIDRFRVSESDSVYYELRYSLHSDEVLSFHPLVRMLVNASTGRLYRYEMAADYLDVSYPDIVMISADAATKLARHSLTTKDVTAYLGRDELSFIFEAELYFVRPNGWLGATTLRRGKARIAWVVPFRMQREEETTHLLFIDAVTGKAIGGFKGSKSP